MLGGCRTALWCCREVGEGNRHGGGVLRERLRLPTKVGTGSREDGEEPVHLDSFLNQEGGPVVLPLGEVLGSCGGLLAHIIGIAFLFAETK